LDQPFITFLAPLAQTLADCKEGLGGIYSLDFGFSSIVEDFHGPSTMTLEGRSVLRAYVKNLAEFIQSNKTLRHVSLCRNGLDSEFLIPVAKAFEENISLESLDLSNNYLSSSKLSRESTISVLVDSLAGKPSLRHVNLSGCLLTDFNATILYRFMKKNPHVTICIADNSHISPSHRIYKLENIEQ
jgi:uncharacterized protein YjbI with pentapeptide repeats